MTETNTAAATIKRKSLEEEFHDAKYSAQGNEPAHYALNPTFYIFQEMLDRLGDIRGKRILECGCGNGWVTAELAAKGALVHAFDISGESVKATEAFLARHGLAQNCVVEKKSAEEIDYPEGYFDYVVGFAILHHVDLAAVIPRIVRVLKPSGSAVFAEPLRGNPFLALYRRLTPGYRTPDETPLAMEDFTPHLKGISRFRHAEFYLLSLVPLFLSNLTKAKAVRDLYRGAMRLDRFLLERAPFLGRWAWYSLLSLEK